MEKNKLFLQIIRFGAVGVVAALVDIGVLTLLREGLGAGVLWASAAGFSVSVVVNYILSMAFVFRGKKQSRLKEFVLFVLLSIGGLCINQLIMWFGTQVLSVYYLAVKIGAMVLVPVYNFVTRKLFLEDRRGHEDERAI